MSEEDDFDDGDTFRHFCSLYTNSSSAGFQINFLMPPSEEAVFDVHFYFQLLARIMRMREAQVSKKHILGTNSC